MNIEQIVFQLEGRDIPVASYVMEIKGWIDDKGMPAKPIAPQPIELVFSEFNSELLSLLDDHYRAVYCSIKYYDQHGDELGGLDLERAYIIGYKEEWDNLSNPKCKLRVLLTCERMSMSRGRCFEIDRRWPAS